jgi:hypothetical protein
MSTTGADRTAPRPHCAAGLFPATRLARHPEPEGPLAEAARQAGATQSSLRIFSPRSGASGQVRLAHGIAIRLLIADDQTLLWFDPPPTCAPDGSASEAGPLSRVAKHLKTQRMAEDSQDR